MAVRRLKVQGQGVGSTILPPRSAAGLPQHGVWMEMSVSDKYHLTEWGVAASQPRPRSCGQTFRERWCDFLLRRHLQLSPPSPGVDVPPGPFPLEQIVVLYLVPGGGGGGISQAEWAYSRWVAAPRELTCF